MARAVRAARRCRGHRRGLAYAGAVRAAALSTICALLSACGGESGGESGGETGGESGGSETIATTTGANTTAAVDPTEGELEALALPMLWMPVAEDADPLALHRPADVNCPLGAWLLEPLGLEVNTQTCNYASFAQPSLVEVVPGARIVGSLYYFDLIAAEPATAHVALFIGAALIWEQEIAIPGPANAFTIDVPADLAAPMGTPVNFHLHNHGQNSWTFGALKVERFDP